MSEFTDRAIIELDKAGLFSKESDYDGMIGTSVMELINTFSTQGHSGFSAHIVSGLFKDLVDGKVLTPITNSPDEWTEVTDNLWQNKRRPTSFSRDNGITWYDIEDESLNNGDVWDNGE